jgi:wobble nucleotide-excising tRNase
MISTDVPFRGLHTQPFGEGDAACMLGKRTVVYGRNGAGKTSLSELLRIGAISSRAEGAAVTAALRVAEVNRKQLLADPSFPLEVMVYNRFYVAESLNLFLDGTGVSEPILKLGKVNVEAATQIALLRDVEARLVRWNDHAAVAIRGAASAETAAENSVKAEVIAHLSPGDPARYGTATYRVDRVRRLFENQRETGQLEGEALTHQVSLACAPERPPVELPQDLPLVDASLAERAGSALSRVVESVPVSDLRSNKPRETWTEAGLTLHSADETCLFCRNGIVTEDVLETYRRHFSVALNELRSDLQTLIESIDHEITAFEAWFANLRDPSELLPDHRPSYTSVLQDLATSLAILKEERSNAVDLLRERLADPLAPLDEHRARVRFAASVDQQKLAQAITRNNTACLDHAGRKRSAQVVVEEHTAAVHYNAYALAKSMALRAERCQVAIERHLRNVRHEMDVLEKSQQDTGIMAMRIDSDLRDHFGHDHLSVSVSEDGKGYRIARNGDVASSLSEGERNAIAFSYFLESLDAEGKDPAKTLVVVDDPVTSMDKESLFAAFALAEAKTEKMHQTIFLTHDYEYFRLQVRQRKNAFDKSQTKIMEGHAEETAFPAVSILEMVARATPDGGRVSQLRPLSQKLLRHPSEYHYLFSKVANAVAFEADDELPLLGNAARRLVEGFITFRAPHAQDFQARIDSIAREREVDPTLSKRVVKFLHGQSHREDPNPESSLDFPSVEIELKAVLEFMRQADEDHFINMCRAVGVPEDRLRPEPINAVAVALDTPSSHVS